MPYDIGRDGQATFRSSPRNTNNTTPQITPNHTGGGLNTNNTTPQNAPNDRSGGFNGWWISIPIMIILLVYFIYPSGNKNSSNPIHQATSNQISVINRNGYISASQYANIRNGPSTNNGIITKKYRGESVYILEKDLATGWFKVIFNDNRNTGYVSDKLISFNVINISQQQTSSNESNSNINERQQVTNSSEIINKQVFNKTTQQNEQNNEVQDTYIYNDGRKYRGTLINGIPNGKGKEYFPDNTVLIGSWKEGKREGVFTCLKSDGSSEEQEFNNGKRIR